MAQELDEYRDYAPKGTVEFLYRLSDQVAGRSFLHVSAGRYGGGMAEILRRLVPMLNTLGINARWEVLAGDQEFFQISRRLANSLQRPGRPSDRADATGLSQDQSAHGPDPESRRRSRDDP